MKPTMTSLAHHRLKDNQGYIEKKDAFRDYIYTRKKTHLLFFFSFPSSFIFVYIWEVLLHYKTDFSNCRTMLTQSQEKSKKII